MPLEAYPDIDEHSHASEQDSKDAGVRHLAAHLGPDDVHAIEGCVGLDSPDRGLGLPRTLVPDTLSLQAAAGCGTTMVDVSPILLQKRILVPSARPRLSRTSAMRIPDGAVASTIPPPVKSTP